MNIKILNGILAIITALFVSVAMSSCSHNTPSLVIPKTLNNSIVQVWRSGTNGGAQVLEALGVAIGDGTTILTVINYEDYTPGQIEVVSHGHSKFAATIQAIDSRTGATLLKLGKGKLPTATVGDATTLNADDLLTIWNQKTDSDSTLQPTEVAVRNFSSNFSKLDFNVIPAEWISNPGGSDGVGAQYQGAVVIDQSGKVVGLVSAMPDRLIPISGGVGYVPPIISINSALELLSPNANNQPWANGPFLLAANEIGSRSGNYDGLVRDYVPVATAITTVLSQLGEALPTADLPHDFRSYVWDNEISETSNGSLLTTVFPRPVELHDSVGNILAQAKWVGIQWDRNDGKPSRVIYGSTAYIVGGSFEIRGDISSLENAVRTLLNDQIPYGQ